MVRLTYFCDALVNSQDRWVTSSYRINQMLKGGLSSKQLMFLPLILNACIFDSFLLSLHVCTVYTHTVAMQVPSAHCMANSLNIATSRVCQWASLSFTNSLIVLAVHNGHIADIMTDRDTRGCFESGHTTGKEDKVACLLPFSFLLKKSTPPIHHYTPVDSQWITDAVESRLPSKRRADFNPIFRNGNKFTFPSSTILQISAVFTSREISLLWCFEVRFVCVSVFLVM